MLSGYHAFSKRDNGKLGLAIDCGLVLAVLALAIWYLIVPRFWEMATSGREVANWFWLSWYPLALGAGVSVLGGFCGTGLHQVWRSWFSTPARVVLFLGLVFIAVVLLWRVQTIRRLSEAQEAHLNRWVAYREQAKRQQEELLSALSTDERKLSGILQKGDSFAGMEPAIGGLRDQVEGELDLLNNLRLDGREQAMEVELALAHDLRAQGVSPDAYLERLARLRPGSELIESQNGPNPFARGVALALAAAIVESGVGNAP
jgi:hypothetical protein